MNEVLRRTVLALLLLLVVLAASYTAYQDAKNEIKGPAVATLMRRPVDIVLWLNHHRKMGIKHFYIRLEDSPGWVDMLNAQPDVTLMIASSDNSGNNYETLQYRQSDFVTWALQQSMGKYTWVFHIDADELLHGSLSVLQKLPDHVKCIHMQNVEAVYDPKNNDTCFSAKTFLKCSHGAPCKSYANGKGAGRVEDGVAPHGPHMFMYKNGADPSSSYDIPFNDLHILHFDACSFGTWVEKYYHLGNNKKDNIPFAYYNESIDATKNAFDTYQKYKMNLDGIDESHVYTRDNFMNAPIDNTATTTACSNDGDKLTDCYYGGMGCAWVK